jgi:hypothetical protein
LYSVRARAKKEGLDCTLTIEDIHIPDRCPVFGTPLRAIVGCDGVSPTSLRHSPSVDRVNNDLGYTKDNICVISFRANDIKKDATLSELRGLLAYMMQPSSANSKDNSGALLERAREIVAQERGGNKPKPHLGPGALPCSACGRVLPLDNFRVRKADSRRRVAIDGTRRDSFCNECARTACLLKDPRLKLLYAAKARAKRLQRDFDLSPEDIIIPRVCPALGIELRPALGEGRSGFGTLWDSPVLDRIDSSKGYTKDNVQVISFRANNLKKDATAGEIHALVDYVETFHEANTMLDPLNTATTTAWRMVR